MSTSDDMLTRWGLHELEGSGHRTANDAGSSGIRTMQDMSIKRGDVGNNPGIYIASAPSTTSDALIAQALQEEFQRLDATAAAGGPTACVNEQEQESVLEQEWVDKSGNSLGGTSLGEGSSGPYGSTVDGSKSSDGSHRSDDDRQYDLNVSEDYQQVDQEVARRLTKLESIKHVPRTNSIIPTFEYASTDHQRILARLAMYGLTEQKIKGDGNCQFRALSDQLYGTPRFHKHVRKSIVKELKTNSQAYADYVPMDYTEYVNNLAQNTVWGDHVTLQAASDYYGVKIRLITTFKDTCFIEIAPLEEKIKREIYLSFWAEVHYNSIYPIGDMYGHRSAQHHVKKVHLLKEFL